MVGGVSCVPAKATFDCHQPQLYDLDVDVAEEHDLAKREPAVLAAIADLKVEMKHGLAKIEQQEANIGAKIDRKETRMFEHILAAVETKKKRGKMLRFWVR